MTWRHYVEMGRACKYNIDISKMLGKEPMPPMNRAWKWTDKVIENLQKMFQILLTVALVLIYNVLANFFDKYNLCVTIVLKICN